MNIHVAQDGDTLRVTLKGALNEHTKKAFEGLGEKIKSHASIVFECGGVEKINSLGISYWIDFLGTIPAEKSYTIEAISPELSVFANMLDTVLGRGQVKSFYIAMYCEKCDNLATVLVDLSDEIDVSGFESGQKCPSCQGALMIEDDLEDQLSMYRGHNQKGA